VNLQQLRDAVRRQLDVDEEELPNETVDDFLREAFTRTINFTNNWPLCSPRSRRTSTPPSSSR
jgi:hypothetical protein